MKSHLYFSLDADTLKHPKVGSYPRPRYRIYYKKSGPNTVKRTKILDVTHVIGFGKFRESRVALSITHQTLEKIWKQAQRNLKKLNMPKGVRVL